MATTSAKLAGGSKLNNGGTLVAAGTAGVDSPISNVVNTNELNTGKEYGSKVVANVAVGDGFSDPHGVTTAKSGGSGGLAYYPSPQERNFLIRAAGSTGAGKINNDASSLLTVPGGVSTKGSIHKVVTTRQMGTYSTASYNVLAYPSSGVVPGRVKGTGAGNLVQYVETDGISPAFDDAATPTRAVPGELTYHFGKLASPYNDNYKAKDSFES